MLPYYALLIWTCVLSLIGNKPAFRISSKAQFILCVLPAVVISALRGVGVGTDTEQYVTAVGLLKSLGFEGYMSLGMYGEYEPGFILLLKLCTFFPDPALSLIVITSILIFGIQYYVIFRASSLPGKSYVLYYLGTMYYFGLTGMRQAIAVSFVMLAFLSLMENRNSRAALWLALAVCFHYTALIAIPLFLVCRVNLSRKVWRWIGIAIASLILMGPSLPLLFTVIGKYNGYVKYGSEYLVSGRLMPLIQIVFFGYLLFAYRYAKKNLDLEVGSKKTLLVNIGMYSSLIGIFIGIATMYVNLFYRFMYYLIPIHCIALPTVFNERLTRTAKLVAGIALIAFALLFVAFLFVDSGWFGIDQYNFYWN